MYLDKGAKNVKIHSTCSQQMVLHYPQENGTDEDEWIDACIPETFVTVIKNDKIEIAPMEGLE